MYIRAESPQLQFPSSLIVCGSHEKSAPESQMPISNLVRSGDAIKSSESRVRSTKIPLGVGDMITMPKTKQSPRITLQSLPTELLTEIVTLLEPVDRASLAFTSSWFHGLFGNTTKLNGFDS
ncbi:hypothetical protein LB504_011026 [Fusarium proliferatum]|nr:hypothetical protein LB504_011026 [Fusarium proliferatum]